MVDYQDLLEKIKNRMIKSSELIQYDTELSHYIKTSNLPFDRILAGKILEVELINDLPKMSESFFEKFSHRFEKNELRIGSLYGELEKYPNFIDVLKKYPHIMPYSFIFGSSEINSPLFDELLSLYQEKIKYDFDYFLTEYNSTMAYTARQLGEVLLNTTDYNFNSIDENENREKIYAVSPHIINVGYYPQAFIKTLFKYKPSNFPNNFKKMREVNRVEYFTQPENLNFKDLITNFDNYIQNHPQEIEEVSRHVFYACWYNLQEYREEFMDKDTYTAIFSYMLELNPRLSFKEKNDNDHFLDHLKNYHDLLDMSIVLDTIINFMNVEQLKSLNVELESYKIKFFDNTDENQLNQLSQQLKDKFKLHIEKNLLENTIDVSNEKQHKAHKI